MSCRLPVCSEFYSFPSSAQLCSLRGLDPANYTLPRICQLTIYQIPAGRHTGMCLEGGRGENPLRILFLLQNLCPAVEAAGGSGLQGVDCSRSSLGRRLWLQEPLQFQRQHGGQSRCRRGQFQGERLWAHLSSLFFWWQWLYLKPPSLLCSSALTFENSPYFKPPLFDIPNVVSVFLIKLLLI